MDTSLMDTMTNPNHKALHTRQHISICRLHIHRHFNHTLTSISEEGTPTPVKPKEESKSRHAFIRVWKPFRNITDTWALLRAVELKYGKVLAAVFRKDYEVENRYQMHTFILFQDLKSLKRVPILGEKFHIPAPVIEDRDRPGGPGLDDIEHLIRSTDRDESFEFLPAPSDGPKKSKKDIIGAEIHRSHSEYYEYSGTYSDFSEKSVAKYFLLWGGFHRLIPMGAPKGIGENVWFGKPSCEQIPMRVALLRCSEITGLRNNAVTRKLTGKNDKKVSDSNPGSASMDSPESISPPPTTTLKAHKNDGKVSDSSSVSASMDSPESISPPTTTLKAHKNDGNVSDSSPGSASMDSPEPISPLATTLKAHKNDGKVSDSSSVSASMDSLESIPPPTTLKAHKNDGKVSDSSPGSASMDSPESSSPTSLDIPISHESTSSKSTQSRSLQTEFPQPPSQSPPELTQLPLEPTTPPEPTIPPPGQQLSPEQLQEQMSKAEQLEVNKQ